MLSGSSVPPVSPPQPSRPLPSISRVRPQLFYGWFIVAGTFSLSFVSVGIGFYGQTIFLDGVIREFGWSSTSVSGASTLYFITAGLVGLGVGRLVDRVGPRIPLIAGAFTMALGLVGLGSVDEPSELYLTYFVLATGFALSGALPLSSIINRWFVTGRARAMSFSQTGVSVGGLAIVPAATGLIADRGVQATAFALALLILLIAPPIILGLLRSDPRDHGLMPDGQTPHGAQPQDQPREIHWRGRDALRSRNFLALSSAFAGILLCQTGLAVHHIHLLREHMGVWEAGLGAATLPVGSIFGRLVAGWLADRVDKRWVAAGLFATQALALGCLAQATGPATLLAASVLFGLTVGAVFMMQSLLVAELFGLASFGTVLGMLNFMTSIGGGLGPVFVGVLCESGGGYPLAIQVLCIIALVASGLVLLVRSSDTDSLAGAASLPAKKERA